MSDPPTAYEAAGLFGGFLTVCGGCWGGVKWLFGRAQKREAALDRKEAELVVKLQDALKEQGERIAALELDCRKLWMVVGYVVPALHAHDPKSPALARAAKILGDAFPIDLSTPGDMTDTLSKIT